MKTKKPEAATPPPLAQGPRWQLPDLTLGLGRPLYWISLSVFVATFFLNPHGYGASFCVFKNATGADCFGCGMTRGVTNMTRFDFDQAWLYHPFALMVWPFMVAFALGTIPAVARGYTRFVARHQVVVNALLWIVGLAFFIYGGVRLYEQL